MELKVLDRPRPSELHICRISSDESAQCSADIAQRCVRRLQSGRLEIRPPSQLTWFFLKLSNSAIEPGRRKTRCCITTGSRKTFMPSSFLFCLFSESPQREIRISLSSSQPRRLVTSSRYFLVFLGLRLEFVKVRVAIEVTTDQSPHLETKTNDENCSRRILSARPHLTDASESSRRPEWTFDLSSARESAFFKGVSSSLSPSFSHAVSLFFRNDSSPARSHCASYSVFFGPPLKAKGDQTPTREVRAFRTEAIHFSHIEG